jgi:hypothetical protein
MQVVDADGLAQLFQGGADAAVVVGLPLAIGQDAQAAAEILDHGKVAGGVAAFLGTMDQLGEGDG